MGHFCPDVPIYRSGPNCKNNRLPNNIEPSVTLLETNLDINTRESRDNRTDVCVQFTNKKATCFRLCTKSKGFSTEHKWIDHDAEVALTQLSFKAIYGDTKKIPQRKLVWQSPFYYSHQVTNYNVSDILYSQRIGFRASQKPLSQERGRPEAFPCVAPHAVRDSDG